MLIDRWLYRVALCCLVLGGLATTLRILADICGWLP